MVLIDTLLHAFHWDTQLNAPNRSAANNLIEGSHGQVLHLLDGISAGTPGAESWRETAKVMRRRRRGKK